MDILQPGKTFVRFPDAIHIVSRDDTRHAQPHILRTFDGLTVEFDAVQFLERGQGKVIKVKVPVVIDHRPQVVLVGLIKRHKIAIQEASFPNPVPCGDGIAGCLFMPIGNENPGAQGPVVRFLQCKRHARRGGQCIDSRGGHGL